MQEIKEKLRDEILEEIDALNDIDMNSEDYNPAVRGIGELTDKYIELEKIEADRAKSEAELALKAESDKSERRSRWVGHALTGLGILANAGLLIWGVITNIRFETEGNIASTESGKAAWREITSFKRK